MLERNDPLLTRQNPGGPWRTIAIRSAIALALLIACFCLLWFDRDGLRDNVDGHLTVADVIYFTMITITTVGYGDIVPVSERARLIDAFLITPIRLFLWLIFLGTAFDMLFKKGIDRWRMRRIQSSLCGHTIIAGFGLSGSTAAAELIGRGLDPARLVIIDCREEACAKARAIGAAAMQGDASSNELLGAAHVERAASVVITAGRDDTSILIVLTAHALAPDVPVSVVIRTPDNEDIARTAGADHVINPIALAGRMLAESALKRTAAA